MVNLGLNQAKKWYEEHEKHVSTFSLLFGFIFDSLTLKRIDSVIDNVWLVINLLSIILCIIFINREENIGDEESWRHFWLFNILQFSFGALLGASFIFYFRSSTLSVSWPFLLVLLAALIGNEVFRKHYERLIFQLSFLYLSLFVFLTFLIPLLIHRIGAIVFISGGLIGAALIWLFALILNRFSREKFKYSWKRIWLSILSIFIIFNILYFTNLIPPIPLSLKDSGIYHYVGKTEDGRYIVRGEGKREWQKFFKNELVHLLPGEPLYAYSAIFSPNLLNTGIVHVWQYKNPDTGKWETTSRVPLYLSGGRSEGFRTFSIKSNLVPGEWRVNVTNPRGQVIGRIQFEIVFSSIPSALIDEIKR